MPSERVAPSLGSTVTGVSLQSRAGGSGPTSGGSDQGEGGSGEPNRYQYPAVVRRGNGRLKRRGSRRRRLRLRRRDRGRIRARGSRRELGHEDIEAARGY
jgi:hypothetical protein